jgi:uncharacterized protein YjbJ (UPF0337 family)
METTNLKLAAPWEEVKERLKEVQADLSDEDLDYEPGQETALLERVAKKIGKNTDHVKAWIESVSANERPAF